MIQCNQLTKKGTQLKQNDLLMRRENQEVSVLVMLDLLAAFDTIDHDILLHCLSERAGIKETALHWFSSYITVEYHDNENPLNNSEKIAYVGQRLVYPIIKYLTTLVFFKCH